MFCDLAGSTTLSASLDPEDLREVLRSFQAVATGVISRHEGVVTAYLGDGILALFGYPQAHEDDPERAVRAGLEVVAEVRALRTLPGIELAVRVGIATGLSVVGDLIGEGASREEAVVGRTSNLAARLQSLAAPGEVVISAATKRLVGNLFEFLELGPQRLKGFDEPVPAWRVASERPVESRFEATHAEAELGPLVGRERELELLLERWRSARAGKGQVATLKGEPGIGKSRLAQALREATAREERILLRYFCSPRFQNSALYPAIRQMQHAARFAPGDSPGKQLDKLVSLLSRSTAPEELPTTVAYLAALLSIPVDDRYPRITESPERQKERTLEAIKAQIMALAKERPLMMLCEDLHWVDPTTLNVVERLIADIADLPVFVLTTGRPEFKPPWSGVPYSLTLELARLERHSGGTIVQHHTGGQPLPPHILDQILQKSDGIPLFIEELTKAVVETGSRTSKPSATR